MGWRLTSDGDIIVALDGVDVADMDELTVLLAEKQIRQTVAVTVSRGGREPDLEVTLEERPSQ